MLHYQVNEMNASNLQLLQIIKCMTENEIFRAASRAAFDAAAEDILADGQSVSSTDLARIVINLIPPSATTTQPEIEPLHFSDVRPLCMLPECPPDNGFIPETH